MLGLIKNEHIKLFNKKLVWISFLLMPFLIMMVSLFFTRLISSAGGDALDFMAFVSKLLIVIGILVIGIAGTILSNEFQEGTVKFLLIRPVSRSMVLLAKWLTVQLYAIYLLLSTFVFSLLVGGVLFGFHNIGESTLIIQKIGLSYGISFLEIILISTFTLMVSAIFKNGAFSIGVGMAAFFGGKFLTEVFGLLEFALGRIFLFANTQLEQYFFGNEILFPGMSLFYSIGILIMHFIFFYGTAWFFFAKRDITV